MSGVSVGWFDPAGITTETAQLVRAIKRTFGPRLRETAAWPLAVASISWGGKGTGVAYALVGGHIPLHIDTVGLDDSDGRIFQFVLEVENRPAIITAPKRDTSSPIFEGWAPPDQVQTFGLGGIEMKVGQALHFDITDTWHGVTGLPVPMESLADDIAPRAVIVQVAGFAADEIGMAVSHAAYWVNLDMEASSR